jgi:hypothetical protein
VGKMYNFNVESGKTLNNFKTLESYKFKIENFQPIVSHFVWAEAQIYGHEEIGNAFLRKSFEISGRIKL